MNDVIVFSWVAMGTRQSRFALVVMGTVQHLVVSVHDVVSYKNSIGGNSLHE